MEVDEEHVHVPREHLELLRSAFSEADIDQSAQDDVAEEDWSAEEQDRFFAALSSHSSLRPDLIAECVGSKNIAQVCAYLTVLEEAAKEIPQTEASSLRSTLDIAMQVSDDWLEVEEDQATFFRDLELAWRHEAAVDGELEELDLSTRRQEALKALSFAHLKAMDRLLQNDQDSTENPTSLAPAEAESRPEPETTSDLTPAERRRLQKRLYMRRKRAEASGKQFDADTLKLQRGRPKKTPGEGSVAHRASPSPSTEKPAEPTSDADTEDSESAGEEESQDEGHGGRRKRKRRRGMTKEQQALETFNQLEIDSATLADENLNLFHLASLGRLLALYQEAYSPSTITSISSNVIRLLTLTLTDFVTRVVHRSIVLREQEVQLKAQSKVWRLPIDDISSDHVERALTTLGYVTSKAQVFEHLCEDDSSTHGDETPGDNEDQGGSNEDNANEPDTPVDEDLSTVPERDVFLGSNPSAIRLSKDLMVQPSTDSQESLLPTEADEEMLLKELEEEEALDEQDQVLEKAHQDELWSAYKVYIASFRTKQS
ncbi:hypothetical protein GYMLUDRAFT_33887 [Collybiopsis luxurians FD-317 M1]|nr:hypothetical protein GYMLUDRAFT_33887 [Collybiopsis luxurians FD-317 M1]